MGDGDRLVIWRHDFRPRVDHLEPETFGLVNALFRGLPLGALAAGGHPVEQIPRLIGAAWVVGFSVVT